MSQILAIGDYEELYVYRLTEYMNRHRLLPFEVMAFCDSEKLRAYALEHEIAMLLVGKEWIEKIETASNAQVVILSEEAETDIDTIKELPRVNRYQSAEQIARALLEICATHADKLPPSPTRNKTVEIIGIYSPVGRCLKTSFSLTLGQLLAQEKKCLYINMEPYSGFNALFGRYYDHNMSELLYFLEKGTRRFVYKLQSTIERLGNLEYIPPAESFLELMSLEPETWKRFVEEIIAQTDYEVIILDLSDYVSGLLQLLSICDHIFTITRKDGVAMAKLDQYEKMLSYSHQEAILGKTKKFQFPIFKELPRQMEQLPYSELADYTRKLIQEEKL